MTLNYLALGDSYTIGEMVPLTESFPYQLVQLFRGKGVNMPAPEIIAKTGWTTDELSAAMNGYHFLKEYDLVTLLIGVNNQYRGRSAEEFRKEFQGLFLRAVNLAGGRQDRVVVISIPDWGLTPFAADRNSASITDEIDIFNAVCKEQAADSGVVFVDITTGQRSRSSDLSYLAGDQLHPSGKEYAEWTKLLFDTLGTLFQP